MKNCTSNIKKVESSLGAKIDSDRFLQYKIVNLLEVFFAKEPH